MASSFKKYSRTVLRVFFLIFGYVMSVFFKLAYRSRGKKMPPIRNLILLDSATTLAYKIRTRKVTSLEVVESFIARTKEINPTLNCFVDDRFEAARNEAKEVDEIIKSGRMTEEVLAKEKPFFGVPFTTKDCIAVKGLLHTSGLYKRKNIRATEDADVISRLRNAGAIPIGLTNVSELCMWWESNNTVHGRTNNPYDTNHIVGGSSGGEGCEQAAAGSAFGIGSDIGGSIRMPSFFNGIFGHKPSKFIVSNKGQYPIPNSKEQNSFLGIGPMCRRAEDLLPLLKIIVSSPLNELKLDEDVNIKNIRFFYQEDDTGGVMTSPVNLEIKELFKRIVLHLDKTHKIKAQKVEMREFAKSSAIWLGNMTSPGPNFQEQLSNLNGKINLPLEFTKWFLQISNHTIIALFTALAEKFSPSFQSEKHLYWVNQRDEFRRKLVDLLGDDGVLLYPTHPTPAPFHNEPLTKAFNFSYTGIINVLGFPATHCPMGLNSDGLPIGLQVIANDKNDRLCLAVARYLEKAFGGWVPPEIQA
ncbi:fatty-acid amide hydrolase 2-like [Onthophagus taurus]|uniref:fatty-acid amide hydrolase 2-like n=1 Tax=Onthophagus taurus TaxID=166361 RepID=UPI000C1FDF9C|nr:fatty-acid amide hydrolase 2-like [Onthophagus taurus]